MANEALKARYFAPNITDPEIFRGMVEAHPYFKKGSRSPEDLQMIARRLEVLHEAELYGAKTLSGTDMAEMTDAEAVTEVAVLKDIQMHGELLGK